MVTRRHFLGAMAAGLTPLSSSLAQTGTGMTQAHRPLIARAHLFGNPARVDGRVSPDGRRLSWISPVDGVKNLWVAPIDDPAAAVPVTQDRGRGVRNHAWTFDGRHVVYHQDRGGDENWHVHAVDVETRTTRDLTPFDGVRAGVKHISRTIRGDILIEMNRRDPKFSDLYRLNLASGALTLVTENPGFAWFVCHDDLTPHVAMRTTAGGGEVWMRAKPDGTWEDWFTVPPEDEPHTGAVRLDASGKIAFMWESRGRDTAALVRIDLATGDTRVLAEHPKADIGLNFIADIETYEPLAYSVNVEKLEVKGLSLKIQPDLDFIASHHSGGWTLDSRSEDDRFWTVSLWSDLPSGRSLYDRSKRSLKKLYDPLPELRDVPLGRMHSMTLRSRDGYDLVSYLTLPVGSDAKRGGRPDVPLPMVLLVHGGPWGRDQFVFDPTHKWLADRGYAVLNVNFRASTGFGKAFVNAGDGEWGRKMDDDLLDGVAWAIAEGIADPKRIASMGLSYGGYATLVGLTRNPDVYACGVAGVGSVNLETFLETIPPYWEAGRQKLYKAIGDPATEEGRTLLRDRSPLHRADRMKTPLLIFHGVNDMRVKQAESDQMVAAMKANRIPVTYALFPDEGHGWARPENNIAYIATIESFLAQHLGGRADPITQAEIEASSIQVLEGADGVAGLAAAMKAAGR